LINLDFADLKSILKKNQNLTYFQTKEFTISKPTEKIVQEITYNPLYNYDIKGAKRILLNICASEKLPMQKAYLLAQEITRQSPQAKIIFGLSLKKGKSNKIRVTVLATGCQSKDELLKEKDAKEKKKEKAKETKRKKKEKEKVKELKKEEKRKKEKTKKVRKTPLEIKKEQEKIKKKLLLFDDELEIPAFLRRKIKPNKHGSS
jgi:cell division GTPase FtsZ